MTQGGARLTPEAKELMQRFDDFMEDVAGVRQSIDKQKAGSRMEQGFQDVRF